MVATSDVGDELILITYHAAVAFAGAKVISCDGKRPARSLDYDSDAYALDPAVELDKLDCLGARSQ